jgi:hypothetical protein
MFARIYQGGSGGLMPVTVVTEVVDARDEVRSTATLAIPASEFDATRGVVHEEPVPLAGLPPGPYLVSLSAKLPSGYTARKDVLIRVR